MIRLFLLVQLVNNWYFVLVDFSFFLVFELLNYWIEIDDCCSYCCDFDWLRNCFGSLRAIENSSIFYCENGADSSHLFYYCICFVVLVFHFEFKAPCSWVVVCYLTWWLRYFTNKWGNIKYLLSDNWEGTISRRHRWFLFGWYSRDCRIGGGR